MHQEINAVTLLTHSHVVLWQRRIRRASQLGLNQPIFFVRRSSELFINVAMAQVESSKMNLKKLKIKNY